MPLEDPTETHLVCMSKTVALDMECSGIWEAERKDMSVSMEVSHEAKLEVNTYRMREATVVPSRVRAASLCRLISSSGDLQRAWDYHED